MASGENAGRPPLLSLVRKIFLMALRSLDRGWGGGGTFRPEGRDRVVRLHYWLSEENRGCAVIVMVTVCCDVRGWAAGGVLPHVGWLAFSVAFECHARHS